MAKLSLEDANTTMQSSFANKRNSEKPNANNKAMADVDLTCICKPNEKIKAYYEYKGRKGNDLHSNVECPFRMLNRVQKWQLNQKISQRGMKGLPLDGEVLNMTMALFDYTLAPDLINKWIKRVQPFLYGESKNKKMFEEHVREEQ